MSNGAFNGQNNTSDSSPIPQAPIRKKRELSLRGPAVPGDLPPQALSFDEVTRQSSSQPVSGSSAQNLQGQSRITPPPPVRSCTTHLPCEVPGPYRPVVVPPVSHSPPKPLRKDQVYIFEFACEDKGLGIALGIGHHDPILWKSTIPGHGIVYQRKENGDYFQIEELNTPQDFGLRRGDEVLSINGCMLYKHSLDYAGILLAEAASSGHVTLAITRPKRSLSRAAADYADGRQTLQTESFDSVTDLSSTTQATTERPAGQALLSYSEPFNIDLYKEEGGKNLGVGIVGGLDAPLGPIGFFIKTIYPNGLVAEDGRLKTGDEILSLNGVPVQGLRHSEAVNKFKLLPSGPVCLTVRSLVHSTGSSFLSSELKDSSQSARISAESHNIWNTVPFSENANSDSLLDEILLEYGKQDVDHTDTVIGETVPKGSAMQSSFSKQAETNLPLPIVSVTDALLSKIVISHPSLKTSNMSLPNEFQSPVVTEVIQPGQVINPVSSFGKDSLGSYEIPPVPPYSGGVDSHLSDVKEPELVVKHRVINLYENPPITSEMVRGQISDSYSSEETDFSVPPPIKPGDILSSYLVTKKSSENSEATAEFVDPPDEFTSTMYIADDSDGDDNGDAGARSFQKDLGDGCHPSVAVAWSGIQGSDGISTGIGAPVGFGDDQWESSRKLFDNSDLPNHTEIGTSEPLWKDFDLLRSEPKRLATEESAFGVKTLSNSSRDTHVTNTAALASGTKSLNPFADGAPLPASNVSDSIHHEVFNVKSSTCVDATGVERGQNEPRESMSDNSLQENLSPYKTSEPNDAEKWFSDESPDPGTKSLNALQKRLVLGGEVELAPPPNFSAVILNGADSAGQHPKEHLDELPVSSGLKEEEDIKTDQLNMSHAPNSVNIPFEYVPLNKSPLGVIDAGSDVTLQDACEDAAKADAWLEACVPSATTDSSASMPKPNIPSLPNSTSVVNTSELFGPQVTSKLDDSGRMLYLARDHDATVPLSSSPLPPSPPAVEANIFDSFEEMSEPPPLPSSVPPPLPGTPPPPNHRSLNNLHLESTVMSDLAPPSDSLFSETVNWSNYPPAAWKSDLGQKLTYDISHDFASSGEDVRSNAFTLPDSIPLMTNKGYPLSSYPTVVGVSSDVDPEWDSNYSLITTPSPHRPPSKNYEQIIDKGVVTSADSNKGFHGPPVIPKDQSSRSSFSSQQTSAASMSSDKHLEYRAGSYEVPATAAETEMFSSVAGMPDDLSLSHNSHVDSENDQCHASNKNSSFADRIHRGPESFSISEDKISSSPSTKITSTSFSTSRTDFMAFPAMDHLDKLQLTRDSTSLEPPLHIQETFSDKGGPALGESEETLSPRRQLDFRTSVSVSESNLFHTLGDQVAPEEENRIRSETEPFQVKVSKNLWGLGMTVFVTRKGAVISNIQKMGPVGRCKDIQVNDYLLAVNGISLENQTTDEIQGILNALPTGIVRLTVSALPPVSTSNDQGQFENQLVGDVHVIRAQDVTSPDLSIQSKSSSSPSVDFDATSPLSTPACASSTDAFSVSRRSISRDDVVGSVLKDYYTVEVEEKPKEEISSKPKKPLIAQALLPKSKRSGSLVPVSSSSTPDAKTSRSLSSASSHSECLDASLPERKLSEDVANNPIFEEQSGINFSGSKDLDGFQKNDDDSASVFSDSSSIHSAGYSSHSSENSVSSRSRALAEVETEYTKKVASSKAFFESIQADTKKTPSSKSSGSKNKSTSEITPRSADFQESISSGPTNADKDEQDLMLKSESVTSEKGTAVDSENLNIAGSKAFFRSMESSKKQTSSPFASHGRSLPQTALQTSVSHGTAKMLKEIRMIPEGCTLQVGEANSVSEFQSYGGDPSSGSESKHRQIENENWDMMKLTETNAVLDSESINVAESKAFFKSIESTSKPSSKSVAKPTRSLPVIGSKTGVPASTEQKLAVKELTRQKKAEEFSKSNSQSEPGPYSGKIQEMKETPSDNESHDVELVKVTETKAFFESLKPSTSINRDKIKSVKREEESLSHLVTEKLNAAAQEPVSSAAELKSQLSDGAPNQSAVTELDKPRAVIQPVFRKESAPSVNQLRSGGRLPTLPSQKYLPVPSGLLPKSIPSSSTPLRQAQKSAELVQGDHSSSVTLTPQTPEGPREQKDVSINAADANEEQQKSVGNLVSKFATLSPEPKATFTGELKTDAALHVKRESPGQVRYQYRSVGDSSKTQLADTGIAPVDAGKVKRPMPPGPPPSARPVPPGPPPSATTPSPSAGPTPVISSSANSQKWKQFMTNYSSMK